MPLTFSGCDADANAFIEKHFLDCVYDGRDAAGFTLGIFSILVWIVAQMPQFISNFRNQSSEALSIWFLTQWFAGDTLNLLGCLIQGEQLPTTTILAGYFVLSDVFMLMQFIYYGALQARRQRALRGSRRKRRHHHHHNHAAGGTSAPLLINNGTDSSVRVGLDTPDGLGTPGAGGAWTGAGASPASVSVAAAAAGPGATMLAAKVLVAAGSAAICTTLLMSPATTAAGRHHHAWGRPDHTRRLLDTTAAGPMGSSHLLLSGSAAGSGSVENGSSQLQRHSVCDFLNCEWAIVAGE